MWSNLIPPYIYVCWGGEGSSYSKSNYKRVTFHSHHSFFFNLMVKFSYSLEPLDVKKMNGEDEESYS